MSRLPTIITLLTALAAASCGPADAPTGWAPSVAVAVQPVTVNFYKFSDQKSASDPGNWGALLLDIERHLPSKYGTTYQDSNKETHGHETTHGINSHLRNYHNKTGAKANGFYLLKDRAFIIPEPKIKKSHAASYIPSSLRGFRYSTYVSGQSAWDNEPLYLFDEWVAYINGGKVGVARHKAGLYKTQGGWTTGVVDGALEFTPYAIGLVMAVEKGDPSYLPSRPQFKQFFAWLLVEALDTFRAGNQIPAFKMSSQQVLYNKLNGGEGAGMRAFVKKLYGQSFTDRVFKGTKLPQIKPDKGTVPPPKADAGVTPQPPKDTQAPTVTLVYPPAGAVMPTSFQVRVQASDNGKLARVELLLDGQVRGSLKAPPFHFKVAAPVGPHTLLARAFDSAGNKGSVSRKISVKSGANPPPPPPSSSPDGGPSLTPGQYGGLSSGCSTGGSGEGPAIILPLIMLFLLRRRAVR